MTGDLHMFHYPGDVIFMSLRLSQLGTYGTKPACVANYGHGE